MFLVLTHRADEGRRRTDQTKQAEDASKDFDDEHFDEEGWVGGVCEGGGATCDADAEATKEVADADGEAAKEERKAWWGGGGCDKRKRKRGPYRCSSSDECRERLRVQLVVLQSRRCQGSVPNVEDRVVVFGMTVRTTP